MRSPLFHQPFTLFFSAVYAFPLSFCFFPSCVMQPRSQKDKRDKSTRKGGCRWPRNARGKGKKQQQKTSSSSSSKPPHTLHPLLFFHCHFSYFTLCAGCCCVVCSAFLFLSFLHDISLPFSLLLSPSSSKRERPAMITALPSLPPPLPPPWLPDLSCLALSAPPALDAGRE
jgi:hypothetical protein